MNQERHLVQPIVNDELEYVNHNIINIINSIKWNLTRKDVNSIEYCFYSNDQVADILRLIPHPGVEQQNLRNCLTASHPVVNRFLNTPINDHPLILYFPTDVDFDDPDRHIYDNIRTAFDFLGAIYTYYLDRADGNPAQIKTILSDDVYLDTINNYDDGYMILTKG